MVRRGGNQIIGMLYNAKSSLLILITSGSCEKIHIGDIEKMKRIYGMFFVWKQNTVRGNIFNVIL